MSYALLLVLAALSAGDRVPADAPRRTEQPACHGWTAPLPTRAARGVHVVCYAVAEGHHDDDGSAGRGNGWMLPTSVARLEVDSVPDAQGAVAAASASRRTPSGS